MKTLPISYIGEALSYEPESGEFRWKERPREHFRTTRGWRCFNSRFAGKPAGTLSESTGYVIVNFSHGDMYGLHRIAIALTAGEWPDHVDHIDGDRSNNRIGNLRPCNKGQNQCNRGRQRNNTSGFKGVHRHYDGRWRAMITINKITHRLGVFDTPELAHQAYREAAKRLHGDFANAG